MSITIEASPDFMIYFDNVRMDSFVKSFNSTVSVNGSINQASIELVLLPEVEYGVDYLTEVRIFIRNIFTGKYLLVFEGEVRNRSVNWSPSGSSVVFIAKDYLNWLSKIPVPIYISAESSQNNLLAFTWAAQNIDISQVPGFSESSELDFAGKNLKQIKEHIFKLMSYNKSYTDKEGVLNWANLQNRISLMGEIDSRLLQPTEPLKFYYDSADMSSMYTLLYSIVSKLSFEIYQDIDGMIRVKQPYWYDGIPYNHVIDQAIILSYNEYKNWEAEPTRILIQGGINEYLNQSAQRNEYLRGILTPVGVYYAPEDIPENPTQASEPKYIGSWVSGMDVWSPGTAQASEISLDGFYVDLDIDLDTDEEHGYPNTPLVHPYDGDFHVDRPGGRKHEGIDIRYFSGTVIRAQGGVSKVTLARDNGGYGLTVMTDCIDEGHTNVQFLYAHLSKILVSEGDIVNGGEPIGLSGNTGNSSGPHLHFEVRVSGVPQHPRNFLRNPIAIPNRVGTPITSAGKVEGRFSSLITQTEREKKWGVQLFQTTQPLLRIGTDYQASEKQGAYNQLHRYGSYLYHLLKASALTGSLSLIGYPHIRPGFNIWVDPVGLDKIFYVESVNHTGTHQTGVYTNVGISYGRDRRTFLMNKWFKLGKNIFLNDEDHNFDVTNFSSSTIAATKSDSGRTEMADMTKMLKSLRENIANGKFINATVDRDEVSNPYYRLYKEHQINYHSDHFNRWDYEMNPYEVQLILDARFKSLDDTVKTKALKSSKISSIVKKAISYDSDTLYTPSLIINRAKTLKDTLALAKPKLEGIFMNRRGNA